MKIAAMYSINNGEELVFQNYQNIYKEMVSTIHSIDSEKAIAEGILHTPLALRVYVKQAFKHLDWQPYKTTVTAPDKYYTMVYEPKNDKSSKNINLDMDFIVDKLGIEITFSKHPNMIYSVCTKMAIFKQMGLLDMGIVVLPIKRLSQDMKTEISSFEQVTWDLEHNGNCENDVPVMVLGVDV